MSWEQGRRPSGRCAFYLQSPWARRARIRVLPNASGQWSQVSRTHRENVQLEAVETVQFLGRHASSPPRLKSEGEQEHSPQEPREAPAHAWFRTCKHEEG